MMVSRTMPALSVLGLLACGVMMLGCVPKDALRKQAAFDLNCPQPQVQLQELSPDGRTWGAAGCSKRATYKYQDSQSGPGMEWVRDGKVQYDDPDVVVHQQ